MNKHLGLVVAVAFAALATGCSSTGTSTPVPTTSAPNVTASPSPAAPTTTPTETTPTSTPTAQPTETPAAQPTETPAAQPTETPASPAPPPIGDLQVDSGAPVAGQQGSWCYDGACGDVPAIPTDALPMLALADMDASLVFSLAASHPFSHWSVSYAAGPDAAHTELASGGEYFDPDLSEGTPGPPMSSFEFEPPPSGDWLLSVSLQFGDRGDAVYGWHAVVL